MFKTFAAIIFLQSVFFVAMTTAQAESSDLSALFHATEKLMEQEEKQLFGTHNQAVLLEYMKKYGDRKGVIRLSEKLSVRNATEKEVGTYTFLESEIAKAEIYLGQRDKAKSRTEKALAHAPTLWLSHGNDRPFNAYIDLMGIYLEAGGKVHELKQARQFLDQVAKGYRDDGWRHQLYQNLGRMWAKAGYIKNAREDFQRAIDVALTFPTGQGKQNNRMNGLLSIASFQGQAGLYEDMAQTISMIETNDSEAINAAWKTIQATLDLQSKKVAQ